MTNTIKSVTWEKVYVFIIGTFNDMHAERDYLVKLVFPELREWCERRRLRLVDILALYKYSYFAAERFIFYPDTCFRGDDVLIPASPGWY